MKIIKIIIISTLLFSFPALASYAEGIYAVFVVIISLPVILVGIISTIVLCVKRKFVGNNALIKKYCASWIALAFFGSALCREEFFHGLAYYSLLLLFILIPPLVQFRGEKNNGKRKL